MERINKQITKKQHYIPRFYLKLFSDKAGMIKSINLENNIVSKARHYASFGYKEFFYAEETGVPDEISQNIETWLQYFEDILSKELPRIIERILNNEQINDSNRYTLSALMCLIWLRTPVMREQLANLDKNFINKLNNNSGKFIRKENVGHLQFMIQNFGYYDKGFTNMFFGMKWKIHIIKNDQYFITSDSPVLEQWLPSKTFWEKSFLERNKYFPLTPKILIELTYPRGSNKVKRNTIFNNDENLIPTLNLHIAEHAAYAIYSGDDKTLENLAYKRLNPGQFELEYYDKYVRPWDQARASRKNYI